MISRCAIGRGIGLLDNSQQLGSLKWDMPSAPPPASVAGATFPIIRCACRASMIRGPAASPSASGASRWSIRTASSAAPNQSPRRQKHTIHTIHLIAICHEPDQERSRTPDNAEAPTMDQRFRRSPPSHKSRRFESLGALLPPSPPAEKATPCEFLLGHAHGVAHSSPRGCRKQVTAKPKKYAAVSGAKKIFRPLQKSRGQPLTRPSAICFHAYGAVRCPFKRPN